MVTPVREAEGTARRHIVVLSIGPVQEQIQTARRSRDLWFGSKLLSDMGRRVALSLQRNGGKDVVAPVFPHEVKEIDRSPVGNKITAWVTGRPSEVQAWLRDAADDVEELLEESLEGALASIDEGRGALGQYVGKKDEDRAFAQVRDAFEVVWVAVEHRSGKESETIADAERWLAARKNTRQWEQPNAWAQPRRPKSSLDGKLESVVDEQFYETVRKVPEVLKSVRLHPTERLSGLDLLKRYGGKAEERRFLSTTHVAATPWMFRVQSVDGVAEAVSHLDRIVNELVGEDRAEHVLYRPTGSPSNFEETSCFARIEGQILYPGRLEAALEEAGLDPRSAGTQRALDALGAVYQAAGSAPSPYYAILQADGDRMGAFISRLETDDQRHAFSVTLLALVEASQERVEGPLGRGSLVYSGGDDVLALLPLDTALKTARDIAKTFEERLRDAFPGERHPATMSIGVAIAHAVDPLSGSLRLAREAEQAAKGPRNALAITMDRRSGAPVQLVGRWSSATLPGGIVETLDALVEFYRRGALSSRAGHELADIARLVRGVPEGATLDVLRKVQRMEALRILGRKQARGGAELDDAVRRALTATLDRAESEANHAAGDDAASWLGRALIIAREIAKEKGASS